jgi:hypothetical protein
MARQTGLAVFAVAFPQLEQPRFIGTHLPTECRRPGPIPGPRGALPSGTVPVPVKRHRGKPGHTRDTRDTRTHKGTQTNLTTNQTHQQHTPRTSARRPKPRPTQQPQARSRPLPAADSEEAAPSKPDPASARSQSASPRLLEGGRRNEGACGRRVTAGGAGDVGFPILFGGGFLSDTYPDVF